MPKNESSGRVPGTSSGIVPSRQLFNEETLSQDDVLPRSLRSMGVRSADVLDVLPVLEAWLEMVGVERAADLYRILNLLSKAEGPTMLSDLMTARYGDCVADHFQRIADDLDWDPGAAFESEPYEAELELRLADRSGNYVGARSALASLQAADSKVSVLLTEEFGYLLAANDSDLSRPGTPACALAAVLTTIRSTLAPTGGKVDVGSLRTKENAGESESESVVATQPRSATVKRSTPQKEGDKLEEAMLGLLEQLFAVDDEERENLLVLLRRQRPGAQYGNDLQFEAKVASRGSSVCRVECKNISEPVGLKHVADKLLQQEKAARDQPVDHWILVSPHQDPTNELNEMLRYWSDTRRFPFEIHIWSPQNGVKQLFAQAPLVYREIYSAEPPRRTESDILERLRNDLRPILRLDEALQEYLSDPILMTFLPEHRHHFVELLSDRVELGVLDAAGTPLPETLAEHVRTWLRQQTPSTYLLLAEFGEGKSFFTFDFGRQLASEFMEDPVNSWFPLRMPLRELRRAKTPEDFVRRQLERIGATPEAWARLTARFRVIYILDGFDEMSTELDPQNVSENLRLLWELWDYVGAGSADASSRVLVTSRGRFFDNPREEIALRDRLAQPIVSRIRPVSRTEVVENLTAYARRIGAEAKLARVCSLYDPVGLASKPLFLGMIKETLEDLPDDQFGTSELYKAYVDASLVRKKELLLGGSPLEESGVVLASMRSILGKVAVSLQNTGEDFVDLRAVEIAGGSDTAELLWKMASLESGELTRGSSNTEHRIADARMRVSIRSLLRPVATDDPDAWAVTFFHRSLTEYFLAAALAEALKLDDTAAIRLIIARHPLPLETVQFVLPMIEEGPLRTVIQRLLSLARGAAVGLQCEEALGGNALTLAFALNRGMPPEPRDWSGVNLDYLCVPGADLSRRSFRGSSLRFATLDNCDLRFADLRDCDLTEFRLERTSVVDAIATDLESASILAAYSDGVIREWQLTPAGRWSARTVVDGLAGRVRDVDLVTSTLAIASFAHELLVFGRASKRWSVVSRLPVPAMVRSVSSEGGTRILALSSCGGGEVVQADLSLGTIARTHLAHVLPESLDAVEDASWAQPGRATFGPRSVVRGRWLLADFGIGASPDEFWLYDLVRSRSWTATGWDSPPTAIDVVGRIGDEMMLVVGCADGVLFTGLFAESSASIQVTRVGAAEQHDGPITKIRSLERLIVTGGVDRCVRVWRNSSQESAEMEVSTLFLTPQCRGVRLNGVRGQHEYELLSSLASMDDT
jgi:hypothetical protein